jgi:hypothetical protein
VLSNITSQQIVDQQQGKVDQFKASMAADDAAIQTAETQLEYATITAPSDGRIGVRLVDPGNIVHANDQASLATLVLTRPSAVLFTLPARSLDEYPRRHGARAGGGGRLRPGQSPRARHRQAPAGRQHHRSGHRHHQAQGHIPQRRRETLAGRVRQCACAARHP